MIMKKEGGFTLVELLVVISIMALLSSIVFASLQSTRVSARDAQRVQQLHQMDLALNMYKANHEGKVPNLTAVTGTAGSGCSASQQSNAVVCVAKSSGGAAWDAFTSELRPYQPTLPSSLNGIDYVYLPPASMGSGATDSSYQISAKLEKTSALSGYTTASQLISAPTILTYTFSSSNSILLTNSEAIAYCSGSIEGSVGWRFPTYDEIRGGLISTFNITSLTGALLPKMDYGFLSRTDYWAGANRLKEYYGGIMETQGAIPTYKALVKCIKP